MIKFSRTVQVNGIKQAHKQNKTEKKKMSQNIQISTKSPWKTIYFSIRSEKYVRGGIDALFGYFV